MKQEDQVRAQKLALVNSVSENAYSPELIAKELLNIISQNPDYFETFKNYYNVEDLSVESIALSRNWLLNGAEPDNLRCSQYILKDFRDGRYN